jgi:hypothetical protein
MDPKETSTAEELDQIDAPRKILVNSLSMEVVGVPVSLLPRGCIDLHQRRGTGMWSLPAGFRQLLLLTFANRPALARGSKVERDDPWNSEHIDRLPPEVRTVGKTSPEKVAAFGT